MIKFTIGFVCGLVIATIGVKGVVNVADKSVESAKHTIQQQAKEAQPPVAPTSE